MPTGYTADVQEGAVTDFRTFALRCARAFGACIMQREDSSRDLPKPREVSEYYPRAVADARERLQFARELSPVQAARRAREEYDKAVADRQEYRDRKATQRQRYEAMLAHVREWTPPTPEHVELKRFMEDQLRESIKFDCSDWEPDRPVLLSGGEWLVRERARAAEALTRAEQSLAEEVERCNGANAWITALEESLDGASVGTPRSEP